MGNNQKISPSKLFEEGISHFESGNFRLAGKIFKEVLCLNPGEELNGKATEMIGKLKFDHIEFIIGLGSLLLLLSLYLYFGFLK